MKIDSNHIPSFQPMPTHPRFIDRTNHIYGHYTVIGFLGIRNKITRWLCQCECGQMRDVSGANLSQPEAQSCGCRRSKRMKIKQTIHGHYFHPLYQTWTSMKARCENPRSKAYQYYGKRGIKVCERWQDFTLFVQDMGVRPQGYTLERLNNDSHYSPENCKWASHVEQMNNTRRIRQVTWNGETLPLYTWGDRLGIPKRTLRGRIERGVPPLEALAQPYKPRPRKS